MLYIFFTDIINVHAANKSKLHTPAYIDITVENKQTLWSLYQKLLRWMYASQDMI